jgi:Tfp pilus assembly protein PilX
MNRNPLRHQRGGATLVVTVVLAIAMLLAVGWLNRHLVVEQRMAAQQQRATLAFHAAEAGIDRAIAMLNDPRPIGADCRPAAAPERTFVESHLGQPLAVACTYADGGWTCHCSAAPDLDEPVGSSPRFRMSIEPTTRADAIRIVSTGQMAGAAGQRIETVVARLGAITGRPAAALTARGRIDSGGAALGAHNADPRSGGIVLHAGGEIQATSARIEPPGAMPRVDAVVAGDISLARRDPEMSFAATFGTSAAVWRSRPGVRRISCDGSDCGSALRQAIADGAGHRMIWIDGDLALEGPITLGSADRPIVLATSGEARLQGAVTLHGLLHASKLDWSGGSAPTAAVHGAVVVDGDATLETAADLVRDTPVLDRLARELGSWVRVPGSWRDF